MNARHALRAMHAVVLREVLKFSREFIWAPEGDNDEL